MRVERSETIYFSGEEYEHFRKSANMAGRLLAEVTNPDLTEALENYIASFEDCDRFFEIL